MYESGRSIVNGVARLGLLKPGSRASARRGHVHTTARTCACLRKRELSLPRPGARRRTETIESCSHARMAPPRSGTGFGRVRACGPCTVGQPRFSVIGPFSSTFIMTTINEMQCLFSLAAQSGRRHEISPCHSNLQASGSAPT